MSSFLVTNPGKYLKFAVAHVYAYSILKCVAKLIISKHLFSFFRYNEGNNSIKYKNTNLLFLNIRESIWASSLSRQIGIVVRICPLRMWVAVRLPCCGSAPPALRSAQLAGCRQPAALCRMLLSWSQTLTESSDVQIGRLLETIWYVRTNLRINY